MVSKGKSTMSYGLVSLMGFSLVIAVALSRRFLIATWITVANAIADIFAFNYMKSRVSKITPKLALLAAVLIIPYLVFIKAYSLYLILPLSLLFIYAVFSYKKKLGLSYIAGSGFVSSISLIWYLMICSDVESYVFATILSWTIFAIVIAIIVEYKLPFRKMNKVSLVGSTSAIISIGATITYLLTKNYVMLAMYVPSFVAVLLSGGKLKNVMELKRVGINATYSNIAFIVFALLIAYCGSCI
ncbi:MAG: hypothetical protein F7B61_02745 [Caldisphaeraceae archaeon]|nr:hypothetical protein [Caldisphaeraceae archaeon]